jgi:pyruvate dehydrogenase E2 component (dihydrolipoamide acetyltransferase)
MATDVVMPQMGESIAEGTIVRWLKRVGDAVDRDEPLFEISTDKVDAEIPSPAAGVVTEIRSKEGETVPVNTVVAVIAAAGTATTTSPEPANVAAPAVPAAASAVPVAAAPVAAPSPVASAAPEESAGSDSDDQRVRSSPLVRKIAKEHNIDISKIPGTGISGRVTKNDILSVVQGGAAAASAAPAKAAPARPAAPTTPDGARASTLPGTRAAMSVMRKKIAEHMVLSQRTSAHVHSVFEVDFHRVSQIRAAKKAEHEHLGVKLTYMSFIVKAAVEALRAVPIINSSVDGDQIVYHKDVHIGIAVALDWGLIVPVIKNADEKNLLGLGRAVADLAARARSKQLKPEEVTGGTFTITNPGGFGAQFGLPIINQPQVAILCVGSIEKRPVVVDDAIAIHQMAYLSLGFDHRIIDGAVADQFMAHVKRTIEHWDAADA